MTKTEKGIYKLAIIAIILGIFEIISTIYMISMGQLQQSPVMTICQIIVFLSYGVVLFSAAGIMRMHMQTPQKLGAFNRNNMSIAALIAGILLGLVGMQGIFSAIATPIYFFGAMEWSTAMIAARVTRELCEVLVQEGILIILMVLIWRYLHKGNISFKHAGTLAWIALILGAIGCIASIYEYTAYGDIESSTIMYILDEFLRTALYVGLAFGIKFCIEKDKSEEQIKKWNNLVKVFCIIAAAFIVNGIIMETTHTAIMNDMPLYFACGVANDIVRGLMFIGLFLTIGALTRKAMWENKSKITEQKLDENGQDVLCCYNGMYYKQNNHKSEVINQQTSDD